MRRSHSVHLLRPRSPRFVLLSWAWTSGVAAGTRRVVRACSRKRCPKERFQHYDPPVWQLRQRIEKLDAADAAEQRSSSDFVEADEGGESA